MDFDSIFRISPQSLYGNVLFNPLEEYLYIPSMAVQVGYFQGTDFKVIGYKVHNSVIVRVIDADKSHVFGIQLA